MGQNTNWPCLILFFSVCSMSAQSGGDSLYYEHYTVEEGIHYLIPDTTNIQELTEWDWVEMEPSREVRVHTKRMAEDLSRTEHIQMIEGKQAEYWNLEVGEIMINNFGYTVEGTDGDVIYSEPHSDSYISSNDSLTLFFAEFGIQPTRDFPAFSDLPTAQLEDDGFLVTETSDGYKISSSTEEISINLNERLRIYRNSSIDFDSPYYAIESFSLSDQGYLIPVYKKIKTRSLSYLGQCLVRVETKAYFDYELFYDPAIVTEDQQQPLAADFIIYPNPATDNFQIEYTGTQYPDTEYELSITDQMGVTVTSQSGLNTSNHEFIDVSSLADGYYIIHFTINNTAFTKNLFKN